MNKAILLLGIMAVGVWETAAAESGYNNHCAGFYIGAQVGGGNLHYDKSQLASNAISVEDKGFAGRINAGFDINSSVGVELGYTLYQQPEFKYLLGGDLKFRQRSLDLLGKISLPISCNFSVYAKGGLAYVQRDDAKIIYSNNDVRKIADEDHFTRPMLGVGVSYHFSPRISADLGYIRTFGTDDLEDADFYGGGISLKIG